MEEGRGEGFGDGDCGGGDEGCDTGGVEEEGGSLGQKCPWTCDWYGMIYGGINPNGIAAVGVVGL